VQAAYRNDQRQEYVNNLAYKHGTGLGTAPWYGVPGTAYDFGSSKSAGASYHTDASHPNGNGYNAPVSQYHSQPAAPGHGGGAPGHAAGGGYKAGKEIKEPAGRCGSQPTEHYDIRPMTAAAKDAVAMYRAGVEKSAAFTSALAAAEADNYRHAKTGDQGYSEPDSHAAALLAAANTRQPTSYAGSGGNYQPIGYGYLY